jgi:hypothetical protein
MKTDPTAIATQIYNALPMGNLAHDIAKPTPDIAIKAIAGCLNKRTGKWRATKPRGELPELLWALNQFHSSTGSLWGWPHFADPQLRDALDTLVLVMRSGHSSAQDAWRRAIHGQ